MKISQLSCEDICVVFNRAFKNEIKPILLNDNTKWCKPLDEEHVIMLVKNKNHSSSVILSTDSITFYGKLKKLNNNKKIAEKFKESISYIFSEEYVKQKYLKSVKVFIDNELLNK